MMLSGEARKPLLSLRAIRKSYGAVRALRGVALDLQPGTIHALVGENGAGKSTLLRILSGKERPDEGELIFAPGLGRGDWDVRCIPQELQLFDQLSVGENCFLVDRLPSRAGWVNWTETRTRAVERLRGFGQSIDPRTPLHRLSVAEQALLQIAAFFDADPGVLALDEPTALLGDHEARHLFELLHELRRRGSAILYVSHLLPEIRALADRITVLRDGEIVWTRPAPVAEEEIVEAMIGRRLETYLPRAAEPGHEPLLQVQGLSDPEGRFRDIDLEIRSGEVLGIYGIIGSGSSQLLRALAGLRPCRGQIRIGDRDLAEPGPEGLRRIALLPGDRLREGNLKGRRLQENLTISWLARLGSHWRFDPRGDRLRAEGLCRRLEIVSPDLDTPVDYLSGGNQQKALLARVLAAEPAVLLLEEPTRGVDVRSKAEIHRWICQLAESGKAVLLSSSDLPEVVGLSHRVVTLREGSLSGCWPAAKVDPEEVSRQAMPAGKVRERAGDIDVRDRGPAPIPDFLAGRDWIFREAALAALIAAILLLTQWRLPGSIDAGFWSGWAAAAAPLAVISAGMTLLIAAGAIDLSVGSVLALAAASWAVLAGTGVSPLAALAAPVSLGAALGALNGALCALARLSPIIATLATMAVWRGVFLLSTGGRWIEIPEPGRELARAGLGAIPGTAWLAAAALLVAWLFLEHRVEGRRLLAAGNNPLAAAWHGIRVDRSLFLAFTSLGALAGLGAVLHASRYGHVQNNTGVGFELQAIAAAVIGGARIGGGRGTIVGALLGGLFVSLLGEVRAIWGVHERWQLMIVGTLMLAVILLEPFFLRLLRRVRGGPPRGGLDLEGSANG